MPLAATYRAYASTVWERLSALATWQPDVPLSVGDVVTAGPGGVVTRETNLAEVGVPADRLTHSRHNAAPVRIHRGVAMGVSGSAVASVARARASFSTESSFLVVTAEGWVEAVDSMAVARAVVEDLA